jgi:hypothetical protein
MAQQSVCALRAVDANALPSIDGFPTLHESAQAISKRISKGPLEIADTAPLLLPGDGVPLPSGKL